MPIIVGAETVFYTVKLEMSISDQVVWEELVTRFRNDMIFSMLSFFGRAEQC